ncbi:MAG: PHP domain-containing protein, partial [Bacteroidales bacterium]|nr:PHP domain-containing protein [Bacteroidales bacterium]
PYSAEKVHGISTEKAKTHGLPIKEELKKFNESLMHTRYLVGHNIKFDINALGAEYIRSGIDTSFLEKKQVCTMWSSTDHMKLPGGRGGKFKPPKLIELYEYLFEEKFLEAHNAAADVEATARSFFELLRRKIIAPETLDLIQDQYNAFISKNQGKVQLYGLKHESNLEDDSAKSIESGVLDPSDSPEGGEIAYCHLHVHTQYSILDGAASIPELLKKAIDDGMRAVAITDHGNMFGVKEFHNEANKRGIKPILGCEAYIARRSRQTKEDKNLDAFDHIVLLAKNLTGYRNLIMMISLGWTEGFYYKPRIDRELLEKYQEGIICLSACLGGEIPQAIMHRSVDEAEKIVLEYKRIFGEDFYLELQRHQTNDPGMNKLVFDDQVFVNRTLIELGNKHG